MGLTGFNHNTVITIHGPDISSDISNFPLLVHLSSSCGVYKQSMSHVFTELGSYSNRKKIAFTTSDGTTQCYAEIEYWNQSTPEAWIWVNIPTIYAKKDTVLYLYYDSSASDNTSFIGDIGDTAAKSVWDSNFAAVWHMVDDASVTNRITDSTSNARHATKSSTTQVSSLIGYGQQFSGSGYITVPGNILGSHITSGYTVEVIARHTSATRGVLYYEGPSTSQGATVNEILFRAEDNYKLVSVVGGNSTAYSILWGTAAYSNTSAYYHMVTRKWHTTGADDLKLLVEGYADNSTATTATIVSGVFDSGSIGRRYGYVEGSLMNDDYLVGIITEVRLHTVDRGTEWLAVSAASARDLLISFGSTRKRSITINNAYVNINGPFQAYVTIENNYDMGQHIKDIAKGCDIFFVDADYNLLPFDKINFSWTSSSVWKYEAFVRLTVSSTVDTMFYVCYGNPNYIDYSSPHGTFPKSDGFYAVYHTNLESYLGSNSFLDSGGTKFHGTPGGTIGASDVVTGKIGKAIDFSSSTTDIITLPSSINSGLSGVSTLSVMGWVKPSTTATSAQAITSFDISGNNAKLYFACSYGTAGNINIGGRTTTTEAYQNKTSAGGQFTAGQWHHLVGEWDIPNDNVICYKDSSAVTLTGAIAWTNNYFSADVGNSSNIGNSYNNTAQFLGQLNEIWFIKGLLSQAKIQTFYNNQNSPSTFYIIDDGDDILDWNYAPNRSNLGINQKFALKFRNHSRYSGYTPGWSVWQIAGNILQLSSTTSALGYGYLFKTFKKTDINGKWLFLSVSGSSGSSGSSSLAWYAAYNGTMDETNSVYWPTGADCSYTLVTSKTLVTQSTTVNSSSYLIPLDFDTSTGDYITLAIVAADAWASYTVTIQIRGFQIINPDGTIFAQACLDEALPPSSALVWGTCGKDTGIPHQSYKVIFHDDFESGAFDKRWTITNPSYVTVASADFSTNYNKGRYYASFANTIGYSAIAYYPRTTRCMIVMDVYFSSLSGNSGYIIYNYNNTTNAYNYFLSINNGYFRYYDGSYHDFTNAEDISTNQWRRAIAIFEAPSMYSIWIDGKYLGCVDSISFNYMDNIIFSTGYGQFYVGSITVYDLNQPTSAKMHLWDKRIPFYISKSDTMGTQCNVPVYLPISSSSGKNNRDITEVVLAGAAKKIAVTLGDGKTQCYVEEEDWGTSTANIWFRGHATNLCDTMYYLYYSNTLSDNTDFIGSTGETPAKKVWDNDYMLVSHMKDSSGTVVDSSTNGRTLTKKGTGEPIQTTGLIGEAQDFDGVDDYISITAPKTLYYNDFSDSTVGSYPLHFISNVSDVTTVSDGTNCVQLTNADGVRVCAFDSPYEIIVTCRIKYVSGYNRLGIYFESSINNWVFFGTRDSIIDIYEMVDGTNTNLATTSFTFSGWHDVTIHIFYNTITVTVDTTTISYTGLTNYKFACMGLRTWAGCVGRFDNITVIDPGIIGNLPNSTIEAIVRPTTTGGYIYHEGNNTSSAIPEHSLSVSSSGYATAYHRTTTSGYAKQINNTDIRNNWNQLAMARSSLYVPRLYQNGSEAVVYSNDFCDSRIDAHPARMVETTNSAIKTVYDSVINCKVAELTNNSAASLLYSGPMAGNSVFGSFNIRYMGGTTYNRYQMRLVGTSGNIFFGCGNANDCINIYENISGVDYLRATTSFTYGTTWHTVRFYIYGTTVTVWVDNTSVTYSSLSTTVDYTSIYIYIATWSSSRNRYANIVVGNYSNITYAGSLSAANLDVSSIGRNKSYGLSDSGFMDGVIDELRISRVNRDQGYIRAAYLSNSDQLLYILAAERVKPLSLIISGTVREEGVLVDRIVCLYRRLTGTLILQTRSNNPSIGSFSFTVDSDEEYYVVAFSDTIGPYNTIVFDHIVGVV